ncbi:MAG TPA: hypothetical protein VKC53_02360 [Patescibacteria group bacterium]|nr:hypothetical protein [Patescibacteria group bacterium]
MFAEFTTTEIVPNDPKHGHFEIEIITPSSKTKSIVPAIDYDYQWEFEKRNLEKKFPIVAMRFGDRGMCCITVNKASVDVINMNNITSDATGFGLINHEVAEDSRYQRVNIPTYTSYEDKIPSQVLVEGVLKNGDVPFAARIYYVPSL